MERGRSSSFRDHELFGSASRRRAVPGPDPAAGDDPPSPGAPRFVPSRLRPPRPLLPPVRREGLLRRLSTAGEPVVAVSAPGGYGKTMTLAQWATDAGVPFAWLQADAADADPLRFLYYLTAALGGVVEVDPRVAGWLRLLPPPLEASILPALTGAVAAARPFTLVVDDAHLVTGPVCWRTLGLLADQLPPGAHLCVSGRGEAPLPLARLRAEGRLLEIGPAELAMTGAEASELLALHGLTADDETVTRLLRVTEGWPVALGLVALAGEGSSAAEVLARARGDRLEIADYLGTEVLARQAPEVADFLLRTSILERLSHSLCRAVLDDEAAGQVLDLVTNGRLFVSALDDTGEWYRHHHLAAQFLRAELARRYGEAEVAALHRRAAAWFEAHDFHDGAVRHWLAGEEPGRAGLVVCGVLTDYLNCGRYGTLRRWLESFDDEQIVADAPLLLAAAVIGALRPDSPRARLWLAEALQADVGDDNWPGSSRPLRAFQAGLRSSFSTAGLTQMRRDVELAIELAGEDSSAMQAATMSRLGLVLWLSGSDDAALAAFREAESKGRARNVLVEIGALGYSALVLADAGRWREAADCSAAASQRMRELSIEDGMAAAPALLARARLSGHEGGAGLETSIAAVAAALDAGLPPMVTLIAQVIVAEVLFESGDVEQTAAWLRAGQSCLAGWPDAGMLRDRLARLGQRLEAAALIEPLTPAERRVLESLPTQLSVPEIADRLFLSRTTVKTHVRHIYAKLEVATRTDAVERARALGLLAPEH